MNTQQFLAVIAAEDENQRAAESAAEAKIRELRVAMWKRVQNAIRDIIDVEDAEVTSYYESVEDRAPTTGAWAKIIFPEAGEIVVELIVYDGDISVRRYMYEKSNGAMRNAPSAQAALLGFRKEHDGQN